MLYYSTEQPIRPDGWKRSGHETTKPALALQNRKQINMSKTANGNGDTEFNDEDIDFSDIEAKYGLFFKLI